MHSSLGPGPIHLHKGLDLVVEFLYFGLVLLVDSQVVQQLLLDFEGFPTLMASVPGRGDKACG